MSPETYRGIARPVAPTAAMRSAGARVVRPFRPADAPDLLALLEWMDERPEREVLAPSARRADDLASEFRGRPAFSEVTHDGDVVAFAALCSHGDYQALEGPLARDAEPDGVLAAALSAAEPGTAVLAFAARDNGLVRPCLEAAGLEPFLGTSFFGLPRSRWRLGRAAVPPGVRQLGGRDIDLAAYRALYRDSDDAWAERLGWSVARWRRRLADPDVHLIVLGSEGRPVAHCEVEVEDSTARLAYLGVLPAFRGRGLGRAALALALDAAFARPDVARATARAHEHEPEALRLYRRAGFRPERIVIAHARWAVEG